MWRLRGWYLVSIQSKVAFASSASGFPLLGVEQLVLQGTEERLDDAVVKAVTDAAHRAEQADFSESVAEQPWRVATAVIGLSNGHLNQ